MILRGHSLAGNLLHSDETKSKLRLEQLSNRTNSLILKVVDIVSILFSVDVRSHRDHDVRKVFCRKVSNVQRNVETKLLVQESPTDTTEVVSANVKEETVNELLRRILVGRLAWTHSLVDIKQRISRVVGWVSFKSCVNEHWNVSNVKRRQIHSNNSLRNRGVNLPTSCDDELAGINNVCQNSLADQIFFRRLFESNDLGHCSHDLLVSAKRSRREDFDLQLILVKRLERLSRDVGVDVKNDFTGRRINCLLHSSLAD